MFEGYFLRRMIMECVCKWGRCSVVFFGVIFSLSCARASEEPAPLVQAEITPQVQMDAVRGIMNRMLPEQVDHFVLEIIPSENGYDVFEVDARDDQIVLRGNSGVSLASAYHYYLKQECHSMISWCGDQLQVPSPLPLPKKKIRVVSPHQRRVYFNYCTLNYTASWWDWKRWEREIDFMAMNGVNMPLSVVGLEAVWYYTLLDFNFSDAEARSFLVGPTYFAWEWMTNIEGHGGPLPKEWIDQRILLGRKILERQRALGMQPIQQGFSGHVPRLMKEKYPDAKVVSKSKWCNFEGAAQLDPLDPLFKKFGRKFLETEKQIFGTSHIYAADPFHEGKPPQPGDAYLKKVGGAIFDLINDFDSESIWAMQAWSIREQIACAVPKDRLLVLDLSGGKKSFWGYDFVKGQLHNFGGRINLHGDVAQILSNPFAKAVDEIPECKGTGLFMEGIEQNPVFYEAFFDTLWRDTSVDPNEWLKDYALRRYGAVSQSANQAWALLLNGPYRVGTTGVEKSSIIAARPALKVKKSGPNAGFDIPYNPLDLFRAWKLLLSDSDHLGTSQGYRFDVTDVGRQVLSNLGQEIQKQATAAFEAGDQELFQKKASEFLELLEDVDRLLATTTVYNFGKWVADARSWGNTPEMKDYYEWNASMLVTIWGPEDEPKIFDYSWREWAGLIRLYYLPRWKMFYDHLDRVLSEGGTYVDPEKQAYGREAFRANAFYSQLADWELAWVKKTHELSAQPQGDALKISRELLDKYEPIILKTY
jgi:alpha-N-acetylglucosaminidase